LGRLARPEGGEKERGGKEVKPVVFERKPPFMGWDKNKRYIIHKETNSLCGVAEREGKKRGNRKSSLPIRQVRERCERGGGRDGSGARGNTAEGRTALEKDVKMGRERGLVEGKSPQLGPQSHNGEKGYILWGKTKMLI